MVVPWTRLVVVGRLFGIAAITIAMVIGVMTVIRGGSLDRRAVFMDHLRRVLDTIHQAGGRCAGEHDRERHAERRDPGFCRQCKRPCHAAMLTEARLPWQAVEP